MAALALHGKRACLEYWPSHKVGPEASGIFIRQRPANNLLDLSVVEVDARTELAPGHGGRR